MPQLDRVVFTAQENSSEPADQVQHGKPARAASASDRRLRVGPKKPGSCAAKNHSQLNANQRARYAEQGLCQHCGQRAVCQPRRMCWPCYHDVAIRHSYPLTTKYKPAEVADFNGPAQACQSPTSAPRGSGLKVLAMQRRAELRQDLFHPLDNWAVADDRQVHAGIIQVSGQVLRRSADSWRRFIAQHLPIAPQ